MIEEGKLHAFAEYGVQMLIQNAPQLRSLEVEGLTLSTLHPILIRLKSFQSLIELKIICEGGMGEFFVAKPVRPEQQLRPFLPNSLRRVDIPFNILVFFSRILTRRERAYKK
jgi:hypothetical protein